MRKIILSVVQKFERSFPQTAKQTLISPRGLSRIHKQAKPFLFYLILLQIGKVAIIEQGLIIFSKGEKRFIFWIIGSLHLSISLIFGKTYVLLQVMALDWPLEISRGLWPFDSVYQRKKEIKKVVWPFYYFFSFLLLEQLSSLFLSLSFHTFTPMGPVGGAIPSFFFTLSRLKAWLLSHCRYILKQSKPHYVTYPSTGKARSFNGQQCSVLRA